MTFPPRLNLQPPRRPLWMTGLILVLLSVSLLGTVPPAQAGVFDFLFGGRENRGGRAPNRQKGGGVRVGRLSGGLNAALPYMITPRNTFQVSDQFTIRWHPVAEATTYTVRLWQWQDANGGRQRILWETTTADTTLVYGGNPPLRPEAFYSVEVITDQGVSSDLDPGCAAAGFAVLFAETRSRLQADLAAVTSAPLSPEQKALATADVYLAYQMLDAAIATLAVQLAIAPSDTLYLALGDLYSFSGLNTLAAEHYTQALTLATGNDNVLWQAIALEGLGELDVIQNNIEAALPQLRQAQFGYGLADRPIQANQVKRRIELLEKSQLLGLQPTDEPEGCEIPDL
ncbi:MAG: tetratricopeptide repeat protein [Nodosilinea sp.]